MLPALKSAWQSLQENPISITLKYKEKKKEIISFTRLKMHFTF